MTDQLEAIVTAAARSGELDLMKEVMLWALRWQAEIPREAKKELTDIVHMRIES